MDVVRLRTRSRALPKRAVTVISVMVLALFGAWGIVSLARPAAAEKVLERASVLTDTAQRGTLVRAIRAAGTFVPEHVAVVAAPADGLVQSVDLKPGAHVVQGSMIAQLQNPELEADLADIRAQIVAAQAELGSVREEVRSNELDTLSSAQTSTAEREQDETQVRSNESLHQRGLISDVAYQIARIKVRELRDQEAVAKSKISVAQADAGARVAVAQAKIDQLSAQLSAKSAELDALAVRSATTGVVQSVAVDPGQRIALGAEIARLADQRDLKAVLLVPEADVHDVTIGLPVAIELGSLASSGHVVRIDPAAQEGSVAVDVGFEGTVPAVARPDLHVDGSIELERIPNAVSIARPTGATDGTDTDLYKITGGGTRAVRVHVRLGRGSDDRVQILSGIAAGDTIIISDTSAAQNAESVLIK